MQQHDLLGQCAGLAIAHLFRQNHSMPLSIVTCAAVFSAAGVAFSAHVFLEDNAHPLLSANVYIKNTLYASFIVPTTVLLRDYAQTIYKTHIQSFKRSVIQTQLKNR
eukprot:COSAG01_NODE_568_length_15370_cov_26.058018_3_plen_107_part_00